MAQNFNVSPYYDDFSPSNEFYRILFQPGRAVQARELTQIQSMLQNQISSFGQNIFAEGSLVSGGQTSLDDSAFYLKVSSTYTVSNTTVTVDYSNIVGNYIVEEGSGKVGLVKQYIPAVGTDPTTLYVSIISGPQTPFTDNSTYYVINNPIIISPLYYFNSLSSCSGASLLFHINEAVFFSIGTFCYCPSQTLVVGKYTKTPSQVVGLNVVESIVNYTDDATLLDPALGASNYLAPGADRYKIDLQLATQPYTVPATSYPQFIQLATIVNGSIVNNVTTPIYSTIMDTMAKRSYDTNGNFIVKNFLPTLLNDPQNTNNLILQISAGSAFVQGYEIETISPTTLSLAKARTTATDLQKSINTIYGNYTYVNTLSGCAPDVTATNNTFLVEIHSVTTGQNASTKIGTALIRGLEYSSGTGSSAVFGVFFDDLTLTNNSFASARSLYAAAGTYSTYAFSAIIDGSAIVNGSAQLFFPAETPLVFQLPRNYTQSLANVGYYYRQSFSATVSGQTITFACKTTDSFLASSGQATLQNFLVVDNTTGNFIPLDNATVTLSSSYQAVINFGTSAYSGHTVSIIATVKTTNDAYRQKTLVSNYVGNILNVANTVTQSLMVSDVYQLNAVYEFPTTSTYKSTWASGTSYSSGDVVVYQTVGYISLANSNAGNTPSTSPSSWTALTNNVTYYSFGTGQTDGYYDHGTITRNSNPKNPVQILPIFSYFTHSGYGYLTPQSYPIDYGSIPVYTTSLGNVLQLSDCIDFRPRRTDNTNSFVLQSFQIPQSLSEVDVSADLTYYLGRIDKVILTRDGLFKVLQGVPAYLNPQPPANQNDAITLYVLTYDPYTTNITNVAVNIIPYKRYTMKDISTLDNRLTNVEYYTTLNALEAKTNSTITTNANTGLGLFNNGFVTDTFNGSGIGDVTNPEYRASLDYTNGIARPTYLINNVGLQYNQTLSNTQISNVAYSSLVTLPYTQAVFVNQPIASEATSVNPFGVVNYVGTLKLSPESDVWFDLNTAPLVVTNNGGVNDNYANLSGVETQWNAWQNIWYGEQVNDTSSTSSGALSGGIVSSQITQQSISTTSTQSPGSISSTPTNVVNKSVVPYVRSKTIQFVVNGMASNTQLYLYINGINLSTCLLPPTSNSAGSSSNTAPLSPVVTDSTGSAYGYIYIPNDKNIVFQSGSLNIVISDNSFDWRQSISYATATYFAEGFLEKLNSSIVSTKLNSSVTGQLQVSSTNNYATQPLQTANVNVSTVTVPTPTFSLTSDVSSIREGNTINFLFTTTNVPAGTYQANLSGTITNSGLNGFTLGNTTITTVGTMSSATGTLSIPTTTSAVTGNNTVYLNLEVDVPSSVTLQTAQAYYSNVAVTTNLVPSYGVIANNFIFSGNTVYVTFTANNVPTNVAVSYVISGSTGVLANTTGSANTGTLRMYGPNQSNTLTYTVSSAFVANSQSYLSAAFTVLDGSGTTKTATTKITPVASYALNTNSNAVLEGQNVVITLVTSNVTACTNVPYTITGVSSANINGASLTGNLIVNAGGTASLTLVTTPGANATLQFSVANSASPSISVASANVFLYQQAIILPVTPTVTPSSSTVQVSTPYSFTITNGPALGKFTVSDQYGNVGSGSIPASGTTTFSVATGSTSSGTSTWTFVFSNGTSASSSVVITPAPVVNPVYTVTGPTSVNQTDPIVISVKSTNQTPAITVPWTVTSVDNNAEISGFTVTQGTATSSALNSGSPNYAAYVQSYPDLIELYTDCINASTGATTTIFAQSYPNNGIFNTPGDEYNTLSQAGNPYVALAKQGIVAFGQSHWQGSALFPTSGASQNRVLPTTPYPSGTVTINDSTPASFYFSLAKIYQTQTTGTFTIQFGTPINQTLNISVNNNVNSLLPALNPITQKLVGTGDFIDSNLTIAQALGKYIFVTDGQTNAAIQSAQNSNYITLTSAQAAQANTVAQTVAGWYRNASGLNRNPDLFGLLKYVQSIFNLTNSTNVMATGGQQVYRITTGTATNDSTGFTVSNAVWVNPASGICDAGTVYQVSRTWTCSTSGYYLFVWACDDYGHLSLDGQQIINQPSWGGYNGLPYAVVAYVNAGTHTVTAVTENDPHTAFDDAWSSNNAWWAGAIYAWPQDVTQINSSAQTVYNWSFIGPQYLQVNVSSAFPFYYLQYTPSVSGILTASPLWSSGSSLAEVDTTISGQSLSSATSTVQAQFNAAAAQNNTTVGNRAQFLACTTDPLAQTFFVSQNIYPNGIFLSNLALFFAAIDSTQSVFVQIRPTVNGYPSSDTVVPLSTVWLTPSQVLVSSDASQPTLITFSDLVYLPAGEYAIVVGSASSEYTIYTGTVGQKQIAKSGSTTSSVIANQPNVGNLFKSQNASTWTADQSSDMCFVLYQALFNTDKTYQAVFKSNAPQSSFNFGLLEVISQELDFNNSTTISYQISNQYNGTRDSANTSIVANQNVVLNSVRTVASEGDSIVYVNMHTTDPNVSPVIDRDRMSMVVVNNVVNDSTNVTVPETLPYGGGAAAKYITRSVTLSQGFDATGITVYFDLNMQSGSSVQVFAKVLAADDNDTLQNKSWIPVPPTSTLTFSNGYNDFQLKQQWQLTNISYASNGVTYTNFQTFQVKVVFYSSNPAIVPQIANFGAIATS
jgi:hypothetical protein